VSNIKQKYFSTTIHLNVQRTLFFSSKFLVNVGEFSIFLERKMSITVLSNSKKYKVVLEIH
jgi:hypothetical protein